MLAFDPKNVSELVALLSNHLQTLLYSEGLKPQQWSALRYYDRANATARTVGSFARYHSVSHSAASQTVTSLKNRGLLKSVTSSEDARSRIIMVTARGTRLLGNDPLNKISALIAKLNAADGGELVAGLQVLSRVLYSDQVR